MMHPIEKQVDSVRRAVRKYQWLRGIFWTVAIVGAVGLCLGLIDFLTRMQDPGVRVISTGILIAMLGWSVYRFLLVPLRQPLRNIDVAQRIEACYPGLADRLSSSIEFLHQGQSDTRYGSPALRRAVIASTTADTEQFDFASVIDRRPASRAGATAALLALVAVVVVTINLPAAKIATARLFDPLGEHSWPKKNNLELVDPPTRLALGEDFEVRVIDRNGKLPREVRIHYRLRQDGELNEVVETMQYSDDAMLAQRESVRRPFEYRVEGGDDDSMTWQRLDVIEPARLENVTATIHPPAYTGWPPTKTEKRIRALRNSGVAIRAETTKPLVDARLKADYGLDVEAKIAEDGYGFSISPEQFPVTASGAYWFELTDDEKLTSGDETRWEIRAVTDTPPSVTIEKPTSNLFVTSDASVTLHLLVKDNLAIRDVELFYTRTDNTEAGEFEIPIYQGPEKYLLPADAATTQLLAGSGESQSFKHAWNLEPLALDAGTALSVQARASDYGPQVGQTTSPLRITVISLRELEDRLAERQAFILSELQRILGMQRAAREQVAALEIQLDEVGQFSERDIDQLQAAELNQRQIQRALTSEDEGLPHHIGVLLSELESNQVDSPEMQRRMREILAEVARLDEQHLPVIRTELTSAIKTSQAALDGEAVGDVRGPVQTAATNQDEVIESLERLLGNLSDWTGFRRFARDVRDLQRKQRELEESVGKIAAKTFGKSERELTDQERAELRKLSHRQAELARQLDKVLQGMQDASTELAEQDPLASAALEDADVFARDQGLGSKMRQASSDVEQNHLGQAKKLQQSAGKDLDELLNILSGRREHQLDRLVSKLREAEAQLTNLRKQQQGLRKKIDEEAEKPDSEQRRRELQRLEKQQQDLAEEIARLARKLKRLQADRASQSLDQAASKTGQSGQSAGQGDAAGAKQHARQAEKDLDEAQQQLAEARRRAETDLAREQLAQLQDAIRGLLARQRGLLDETKRLEALREGGRLSDAQRHSLRALARSQELLWEETRQRGTSTSQAAGVFEFAMTGAAEDMEQAKVLLENESTGEETQRHQQNAIARLEIVLEAFGQSSGGEGEGQSSAGQQDGQPGGQRHIAELQLIKLLQQDIHDRTVRLEQRIREANGPNQQHQEASRRLSHEEARLMELFLDMAVPQERPAEDDPESLPDLSELDKPKADGLPPEDELPPLDLELTWKLVSSFASSLLTVTLACTSSQCFGQDDADLDKSLSESLLDDLGGDLFGEDPADDPKPSTGTKRAGETDSEEPSTLDRELQERLGEDIGAEGEDSLKKIATRMRQVQERLARTDASTDTQALQEEIIRELNDLIEQAKQNQSSSSSGESSSNGQQSGKQQSTEGSTESKSPAQDSTNRLGQADAADVEADETLDLMKKTWGELPPRLRDAMFQNPVEEFLPEYSTKIRKYFLRLAEEQSDFTN